MLTMMCYPSQSRTLYSLGNISKITLEPYGKDGSLVRYRCTCVDYKRWMICLCIVLYGRRSGTYTPSAFIVNALAYNGRRGRPKSTRNTMYTRDDEFDPIPPAAPPSFIVQPTSTSFLREEREAKSTCSCYFEFYVFCVAWTLSDYLHT